MPSRLSWSAVDQLCPNRSLKALLLTGPENPGRSLVVAVVAHPGLGRYLNTATLMSPGQV